MSGVGQISHDGIGNVFWSGNDLYVEASASQASGATAVTIADLLAGANAADTPALISTKLLTIGVYNNGTSETITGLALQAQGTTSSGGAFTIDYPITQDVNGEAVSIATGGSQTFLIPLSNGVLRTWVLTPTFGTAPTAGTIDTVTTVQGAAGNGTVLKGSLAPQATKIINIIGTLNESPTAANQDLFATTGNVTLTVGTPLTYGPYNTLGYNVQSAVALADAGSVDSVWDINVAQNFAEASYPMISTESTQVNNNGRFVSQQAIAFPNTIITATNGNSSGSITLLGMALILQAQ